MVSHRRFHVIHDGELSEAVAMRWIVVVQSPKTMWLKFMSNGTAAAQKQAAQDHHDDSHPLLPNHPERHCGREFRPRQPISASIRTDAAANW
jgi:hypothetical protein